MADQTGDLKAGATVYSRAAQKVALWDAPRAASMAYQMAERRAGWMAAHWDA